MPSPKITGLRVSGFKKFQELFTLDLRDPQGAPLKTVVLGGSNGSGKTTLLEAILVGLGRAALLRNPGSEHEPAGALRGAEIELDILRDSSIQIVRYTHDVLATFSTANEFLSGGSKALAAIPVEFYSSWRSPSLVGGVRPMTAGRRPGDTEANRLWRLKQKIVDQRSRKGFQQTLPGMPLDDLWLEKLNHAWQLFHGPTSSIDAQIVDPESEDVVFDLFVLQDGQRVCSVDDCASGEIEILALTATLILQDFDGILLLDEPELHLHPEWQAGLLPALRALAPEAQIIVSTHSDLIWDQAYSYERFLLAPPDDPRVSARRAPEETRG
ncbi:MAG: AAA family ATPase [Pseudomonadota bacterium]